MNILERKIQDMHYERVCLGRRYAKNESGKSLVASEVEDRITHKSRWYAEVLTGGGFCAIQRHDQTKIYDTEDEAKVAGLRLPTSEPWRLIDRDGKYISEQS